MNRFEYYNTYPEARNRLAKCVRILSHILETAELMKLTPKEVEEVVFRMLNSNEDIVKEYFKTKGIKYDKQCTKVRLKN